MRRMRLRGANLGRGYAFDARFVRIADIRPLFDLDHFNFLKRLEAMATLGEQNDIARSQLPALEIIAAIGVKIHSQPAAPKDQYFAREVNRALHLVVDVRLNHMTGGMAHVAELLGKIAGSEKMNTWFVEITAHYDREFDPVKAHSFYHE